jgi:type IV secretory pathway VirB10-like protein
MKGPGMRIDLDVRRHWRCPGCGTERHTPGQVTFVRCHFCKDHPAMSLLEQPRPLREPSPPLDLIIDLHPDDVDAPAFVPVHLREPEPTPPAETITQILAEPPSAPEQPPEPAAAAAEEAAAAEAPEVAQEAEETLPEASGEEAAPEKTPKTRKKKRRSRRQRRRNRSSTADGDSGSAQQAETGSTAGSDDSFGAGVDT